MSLYIPSSPSSPLNAIDVHISQGEPDIALLHEKIKCLQDDIALMTMTLCEMEQARHDLIHDVDFHISLMACPEIASRDPWRGFRPLSA
jgi:hypothetical protein